jgi:Exonuclease
MTSSGSQNFSRTLDFFAGPLVWIDCEMTGLDPQKDKILEIAVCDDSLSFPCHVYSRWWLLGSHYGW